MASSSLNRQDSCIASPGDRLIRITQAENTKRTHIAVLDVTGSGRIPPSRICILTALKLDVARREAFGQIGDRGFLWVVRHGPFMVLF